MLMLRMLIVDGEVKVRSVWESEMTTRIVGDKTEQEYIRSLERPAKAIRSGR